MSKSSKEILKKISVLQYDYGYEVLESTRILFISFKNNASRKHNKKIDFQIKLC